MSDRAQLSLINMQTAPRVPLDDGIERHAVVSDCGRYRYLLRRTWGDIGRTMVFAMLNPSTADGIEDDATVRRCVGFAKREGCGSMVVVNLFAWRSTDPAALATVADPVGPENDARIESAVQRASIVVAAWGGGVPKAHRARVEHVLVMLRQHADVYCLGKTKDGAPSHPLYLKVDAPLVLFAEGPTRDPIPLAAPDGRVFAYACRYCLRVRTNGEYMVRVEPDPDPARAASCCVCRTCGAVEIACRTDCSACEAKRQEAERPAREAREAEVAASEGKAVAEFVLKVRDALRHWKVDDAAPWPLTIVHGRDGIGVLAFPLDVEDVPEDVSERLDAIEWYEANSVAQFGRGETPGNALEDLRRRAREVQAEEKGTTT